MYESESEINRKKEIIRKKERERERERREEIKAKTKTNKANDRTVKKATTDERLKKL